MAGQKMQADATFKSKEFDLKAAEMQASAATAMREYELKGRELMLKERELVLKEADSAAATMQEQQKVDAETRPAQDLTALVQVAMQSAEMMRQQQEAFM